jgi:hypothetical protein
VPDGKAVEGMTRYNKSLQDAGALLALDGLRPPSKGARLTFSGGKPTVTSGPFAGVNEVPGGYWMIQVKSKKEAIHWATRCPASDSEIIEVRQVQKMSEFPADVRDAASGLHEMRTQPKEHRGI